MQSFGISVLQKYLCMKVSLQNTGKEKMTKLSKKEVRKEEKHVCLTWLYRESIGHFI